MFVLNDELILKLSTNGFMIILLIWKIKESYLIVN